MNWAIILIAGSAFSGAFLGCLQVINIARGYKVAAAITSVLIAISQLALYKLVPHVDSVTQGAVFILSGLAGSQSSMAFKAWHETHSS